MQAKEFYIIKSKDYYRLEHSQCPSPREEGWDARFQVSLSKDNPTMHPFRREYFDKPRTVDAGTQQRYVSNDIEIDNLAVMSSGCTFTPR